MVTMHGRRRGTTGLRLLLEALKKFHRDHGFFLSSGMTFNLLICMIPFILLLLSLVGTYLYSSREVLNTLRQYLENVVPSLDPRIMRNILRITRDRKIVGALGIGGLIWTCTWVFSSMRTAFNIVFQVKAERGFLRGKAIDVLMIFLAGIALLLSMTLTSAVTVLQSFRIQPLTVIMGPILRWVLKYLVPFLFTYMMFFLIYKIIPNRKISVRSGAPGRLLRQPVVGGDQTPVRLVRSPSREVFDDLRVPEYADRLLPLGLLLFRRSPPGRRDHLLA